MKIYPASSRRAFTLFEGLVAGLVLLLLLVVFLHMLLSHGVPSRPRLIFCVNNLKQAGVTFRIWEDDNGGKFPMDVPVASGGALELIATGNVAACFQVMSNELGTPKILICPEDARHVSATNFENDFTPAHISYFIGLNAANPALPVVLSGDANLIQNRRPVVGGITDLRVNPVTWNNSRHGSLWSGFGNILLPDGSVQPATQMGLTSGAGTYCATNRLVVP